MDKKEMRIKNTQNNDNILGTYNKEQNAITLTALVITIIILLILAGVTITLALGNTGIISKVKNATEESNKQAAIEEMKLKLADLEIRSYEENKSQATIEYIENKLKEDSEVENIERANKDNEDIIYIKLKKYSYKFEVNSSLQIDSIDNVEQKDEIAKTDKFVAAYIIYNQRTGYYVVPTYVNEGLAIVEDTDVIVKKEGTIRYYFKTGGLAGPNGTSETFFARLYKNQDIIYSNQPKREASYGDGTVTVKNGDKLRFYHSSSPSWGSSFDAILYYVD